MVYRPIIISDIRGFVLAMATHIYTYCRISTAEVEYVHFRNNYFEVLRGGSFGSVYCYYYYVHVSR
jgi:hypothetical protein